ncbi:hypothetical protein HDV06_004435 [Boothiomyces sp. JEL0866]|nr:hypothetical protein HDV06_004435 [Boothiomyces sp. JEL0866]
MNFKFSLLGAIQLVNGQISGQNTIVIPPKCGGPSKTPCPNGLDCVFAPSQISDPNAGGFCVFPGTPINSALFNLPTGVATALATGTAIPATTTLQVQSSLPSQTSSIGYQATTAAQTTSSGMQTCFSIIAIACAVALL